MTLLTSWPSYTDDDGTGQTGTAATAAFLDSMKSAVEALVHSSTNTTTAPKAITDEVVTARGSKSSLDARLDISLNEDGTPLASAFTGYVTTADLKSSFATTNWIVNEIMEHWSAGTTSAPDSWTHDGTGGGTVAQEPTTIKFGVYSAKLVFGTTLNQLYQDVIPTGAAWTQLGPVTKSQEFGFGIWVYSATGNQVKAFIYDGIDTSLSDYHTGTAGWEFLTVARTLSGSANTLRAGIKIYSSAANPVYVMGGMLLMSPEVPSRWAPPAYRGPDVQVFTTSGAGTWTKPVAFPATKERTTTVVMYGGGGGGGGGASLATAVVAHGGAGGGGGAYNTRTFRTYDLGATETLNVGAAGSAGAGGTAGILGSDGSAGGNSTFGTTLRVAAYGGGGGRGGAVSAAAGGGGGGGGTYAAGAVGTTAGGIPGSPYYLAVPTGVQMSMGGTGGVGTVARPTTFENCAEFGGAGGCGAAATPIAGGGQGGPSSMRGGGGGGQGGSHSAAPAVLAGLDGGASNSYTASGGGAVGTDGASPTVGTAGASGSSAIGGAGGGGGGTSVTASTNGEAGGAGGACGGGGGGGGVGQNPGVGGAGGAGGIGRIYVFTY